jgi:phosphoribosylanthranilate isomerase
VAARVKICGVTRAADAQWAVEAGASAIGVILWPGSPRVVSIERAAEIFADVPDHVLRVGVFVDQPRSFVQTAVRDLRLNAIQLHGRENPADYDLMKCIVLKSLAVGEGFDAANLAAIPARVFPLLDAADDRRRGGTGTTIDWPSAAAAARVRPVVLAGGLTPLNVREAIRTVNPYAVDVSSGVETSPGRKSTRLIRAFIDAVRAEAGEIPQGAWS